MKITSRLARREARNTVGVGAVVLALTGALLGAPGIASANPDQALLDLINQQRAQAQPPCKPLTQNPQLQAAADREANDLATHPALFDTPPYHTGSDGSTAAQRIAAAGYVGSSSEIIAAGQDSDQGAVTGWMNSPGHKAAMLNCAYIDAGTASSGKYYVGVVAAPG
jgi:uncharacterized protein YkwD